MKPKKKKDERKAATKGKSLKGDSKEEPGKQKDDKGVSKCAAVNQLPDDDRRNGEELPSGSQLASSSSSYAPRKIVSNWSRYEDDGHWSATDGHDQRERGVTLGVDFTVALNAASEVGEQFRFREEREWDNNTDEENGDESVGYSWLDIDDQVQSLSCIPVTRKLDVDASYFTIEMIERFEQVALSNSAMKRAASFECEMKIRDESENRVQTSVGPEEEDELDALLRIVERPSKANSSTSVVPAKETTLRRSAVCNNNSDIQSLEDWLDTVILD